MVILAFSSLEIGQPSFAFLAACSNLALSPPGIFTRTCKCTEVIAKPDSSFSRVTAAVVSMDCAVIPALPSWAERAMLKHPAWAAATSSSGLVPGCDSNRVAKEYGVFSKTPLGEVSVPFPSLSPPLQCALALRCMCQVSFSMTMMQLYMRTPALHLFPVLWTWRHGREDNRCIYQQHGPPRDNCPAKVVFRRVT